MQRGCEGNEKQSPNCTTNGVKKQSKCRSFHFRYLELCRAKNLNPIAEVRSKNSSQTQLEMYCDKVSISEWLLIIEALHYDQVLQTISLRMRKHYGPVIEQMDTEKKARLFRQKPVICTKFLFGKLMEALSNCIEFNTNLRVLKLEGLPLANKYIELIAKAMASNDSLHEVSFHRSLIGDMGCEAVCNSVKYLSRIEKIDLSDCDITVEGAQCVADMIRMQKISRYTEGWERSLRYRDVDVNSISGLRIVNIARNPQIGDDGVMLIAEVLKEDAWVKVVDMENCGLTDRGANVILDCLNLNNTITDFSVRNNEKINKTMQQNIRDQIAKSNDENNDGDGAMVEFEGCIPGLKPLGKNNKYTQAQLVSHINCLQEQLSFERSLRKKAENMNKKLNSQIIMYETALGKVLPNKNGLGAAPKNFNLSLHSIFSENNDGQQLVNSACSSPLSSPRSDASTTMRLKEILPTPEDDEDEMTVDLTPVPRAKTPEAAAARKVHKVRKVKSEMRYIEPPAKEHGKKMQSKSDYEFTTSDVEIQQQQIETDIGDSATVKSTNYHHRNSKSINKQSNSAKNHAGHPAAQHSNRQRQEQQRYQEHSNYIDAMAYEHQQHQQHQHHQQHNMISSRYNNGQKVIDIDEISLSSTRDSEMSDSDTLRNSNVSLHTISQHMMRHRQVEMGQGEGHSPEVTPRHVFMGL